MWLKVGDDFCPGRVEYFLSEGAHNVKMYEPMKAWPLVMVRWYYKKDEMNWDQMGISEEQRMHVSESEVFETDHYDLMWTNSIGGSV